MFFKCWCVAIHERPRLFSSIENRTWDLKFREKNQVHICKRFRSRIRWLPSRLILWDFFGVFVTQFQVLGFFFVYESILFCENSPFFVPRIFTDSWSHSNILLQTNGVIVSYYTSVVLIIERYSSFTCVLFCFCFLI